MKAQRVLVLALGATLSSSAAATAQASLTGRTITELRAGDYVWPKFSPNGRLLAVSQVLADSAGENTQILILDMRRGVLDTLLSAKAADVRSARRSEEHTSELQSRVDLVCRLLLEKK